MIKRTALLLNLLGVFIIFILFLVVNSSLSKDVKPETTLKTHAQQVSTQTMDGTVFAYYYDWYSAPPFTPTYGHWDAGGALTGLPDNIESAFYPLLGAYSSDSATVVAQHMQWIKQAKVDVIVLSWWGQNNFTDQNVPLILNEANKQGLKVCFMIEPYSGRNNQSITADVKYIINKYGDYPAFYRVARPTLYGPSTSLRPVFFLYGLDGGTATTQMIDAFRNTPYDSIFLGRMDDSMMLTDNGVRTELSYSHLDGLFNYGALPLTGNLPRSSDYILIFSALPGWDHTRILPYDQNANDLQSRENGAYYDSSWQRLLTQNVESVAIISFNEWHEGGQIEPAQSHTYGSYTYNDFEGAYNLTGKDASLAYIIRTAFWVDAFKAKLQVPSPIPAVITLPAPTDTYSTDVNISGLKDTSVSSISVNNKNVVDFPDLMHWQTSASLAVGENSIDVSGMKNDGTQTNQITFEINRHMPGNIKGTGTVNLTDLSILAKDWHRGVKWGDSLYNPMSDMNGDGNVDLSDLSELAKYWGQ